MKKGKCEICKKVVKKGEGITITTDGLKNHTRMHQECFDEMWADFMNLDKPAEATKQEKTRPSMQGEPEIIKLGEKEKDNTTTCDNCGKTITLKKAVSEYCGSGCYDWFCNEECQQAFINKS